MVSMTISAWESDPMARDNAACNRAIRKAWARERELVLAGKGSRNWTPEQRAEADAKCKALSDADTVKTKVERNDSPSVEYKKAFGKDSIPAGKDIDHTIDLQLGGNPDVKVNGKPLDKSVNRSLGKQIGYLIKDFDYGTIIRKFTMVNRQ